MQLNRERLLHAYRQIKTIREFEERLHAEIQTGHIAGFTHPYCGQEAVAVGACENLTDDDVIISTHRGHGHSIAKGCDVTAMMKEIYGRADGLCKSKGVLGDDVVCGNGPPGGPEAIGGIWKAAIGLHEKFGPSRAIDTPISERAVIGAAADAAMTGWRPVAKLMFGGKSRCPLTTRITYGAGVNAGPQHSQTAYAMMTATPGLKTAMPSNSADDEEYLIPFGHAKLTRESRDATIVTRGQMVGFSERAADMLAQHGISCDVLDLRTTSPLDEEAILDPVGTTGRLVAVDEKLAPVQPCRRYRRHRAGAGLFSTARTDRHGDRPPFARAFRAGVGTRLSPLGRSHRGCGSPDDGLPGRTARMSSLRAFTMSKWGIEPFDGAVGAQFLQTFRELVEAPDRLTA